MKVSRRSNYVLLAGASALALSMAAPAAIAQDQDEEARTLGTVVVTTQKTEESIQDVPIAVSAFDEDSLEKLQLAGGPDLVKAIPNVSFTKGNFTGFNFKIRGIGNDAVAQSGDAGVGIHMNDVPLQSNLLFEQEFFDVERIEVLRGPQGTLYGRNATAGVFNLITAKPVLEEFQADARFTFGNNNTVIANGMINLPLGERAALRVAGAYTSRDGYVENTFLGTDIDDRDLRSIRATLAFEPTDRLRGYVMVEHFEEDDTRLRSAKQLCSKDPLKDNFNGIPISADDQLVTSLGCVEAPLSESFERTNSVGTLFGALPISAGLLNGDIYTTPLNPDLRQIETPIDPSYQADQTVYTANIGFDLTDSLLLTSTTSFSENSVLSVASYNNHVPDTPFNDLSAIPPGLDPAADLYNALFPGGVVNDPQLGPSNFFNTMDLSGGENEQFTQEIRLQSDFDGPFNFNLGAIYVDYEFKETIPASYYVISNGLTALAQLNNAIGGLLPPATGLLNGPIPIDTSNPGASLPASLDGQGRNYFRSLSPFELQSFALFGEAYFDISDTLSFTAGLRYTDDDKSQLNRPSLVFISDDPGTFGNVPLGETGASQLNQPEVLEVDFQEVTGRATLEWTPDFAATEDTLIYGSYARGYKGGGINPPQQIGAAAFDQFFDPEFVNAYEIGTKNTFNGGLFQLNGSAFLYDYEGYQITQIINRSSVNFNIDAEIRGIELEGVWNPVSTLLLNANVGFLDTEVQDAFGVDVLDRTNGRSDLITIKNFSNGANCVVSAAGYAAVLTGIAGSAFPEGSAQGICNGALAAGVGGTLDQEANLAILEAALMLDGQTVSYIDGDGNVQTASMLEPFQGEATSLSGNQIPGSPETTFNFAAEYTWEGIFGGGWDLTARGDYYYQGDSFSRIWNTGRDQLDSWDNINLSLLLMNTENDWSLEVFGKNITDEEVITGTYLTDDSSGLFTNIFLTEPQTYGITLTKRW